MFNICFNFINKLKRNLFPFYKNKELRFVFNKLQEGFPDETVTARFVGGCVRKHLTNEKVDDIDIATILSTQEIKEKFKDTKFKVVETGIKHGTITLISKDFKLELTTLRKDVETDVRHAEVEYISDWQLDSERRDFTINAIYLDINGKIFDPQMGTVDLRNNNIKFIGDPQKRIEEDYLRIIRFIRFKIMYDSKVEKTTNDAIKQFRWNKKISKERILIELYKILDLKNFTRLNENNYLREIFILIFPEFDNLERLNRLTKICKSSQIKRELLLAVLLIDEKNNHEYFGHKYNISNNIKDYLDFMSKKLKLLKENKNFFGKDLEKNIYFYDKNHLIDLNNINFTIDAKYKFQDFSENLKRILSSKSHKFKIDGKYLLNNGMKQGAMMGEVLKKVEQEWIKNNFKITKNQIQEIIRLYSN